MTSVATALTMVATSLAVAGTADADPGFTPEAPESVVDLVRTDHPRLILDDAALADVQGWIATDDDAAALADDVVGQAESLLAAPVTIYDFPDGRSLLTPVRTILNRTYVLALSYRLTEDTRFLDRAYAELAAAAQFPDWNPESFLSVAEMLHAFAIGYDWLYPALTAQQRGVLETAMVTHGFEPAQAGYDAGASWTTTTSNWSIVCTSGIGIAALALAEIEPERAESLLQLGLSHVGPALDEYAPDGGYPEGPTYWDYATRYLVPYLASLGTAVGDDFGISDAPGLSGTVDFSMYMAGPSGRTFNYSDASSTYGGPPAAYWLADRYDQPGYAWWADEGLRTPTNPQALLWYGLSERATPAQTEMPLDRYFSGTETVLSRSAWSTPTALFTGFKAGDNSNNHGDLDMGTFVLDALGTRWADELGADSYSLPGYFSTGPDGDRWTYYRKRAEGQNTLVINPGSGPDQSVAAAGRIIAQEGSPAGAFAVADLTEAYADQGVTSWQRGVAMIDDRSRVVVQDELSATTPVEAWWFMHTSADVEIATDGRSAVLTIEGRHLLARFLDAPAGAQFSVMAAEPLPTSPNPDGQAANGQSKLTVRLPGVTDLRLSILLEPLPVGGEGEPAPVVTALADWTVPAPGASTLSDLTHDGVTIPGFSADTRTLVLETTDLGEIEAVPSAATDQVDVQMPDALPGTAVVCVGPAGDECRTRYRVHLTRPYSGPLTGSIVGTNPTSNATDGDLGTFWSAQGDGQWLRANLPATTTVDGVRVAWSMGSTRVYSYDVQTSLDGEQWSTVWSGASSGTTLDLEDVAFDPVQASYVRILAHGNSANMWMSLSELRVRTAQGEWPQTEPAAPDPVAIAIGSGALNLHPRTVDTPGLTVTMSDGSTVPLDLTTASVRSSDAEVAEFTSDGVVVARSVGSTLLTALWRSPTGTLVGGRAAVSVTDPSTTTLAAARDGYVRDGTYADTSYGSATSMTVKRDPSGSNAGFNRETYLAFDLEPADGRELVAAELVMTAGVTTDRTMVVDVSTAGADWTEATLTWNSRPAVGVPVAQFTAGSEPAPVSVDVTDAVAAVLGADEASLGFALLQNAQDRQAFGTSVWSRERGAGGPTLVLHWAEATACSSTVTGSNSGAVTLTGPVACLVDADVRGPVTATGGTSVRIERSTIAGPVTVPAAGTVVLTDATINGPVQLSGEGAVIWVASSTIRGPLTALTPGGTLAMLESQVVGTLTCSEAAGSVLIETEVRVLDPACE
ncbi:DNRLRE domain-containing protein [Occultella glacieicola]|uniref:DNRLRE domain-containing protein n=1 Tax=Occultella glacieicola TaxID=2518684 RepID=A0ABY2E786_9MICO|nr:DNRLRE domain-containing protein [Occultella glacieicola]TDE97180.1 DNRLRE domain-containing protein [Occultella glacieicola]